jgi:iron complex outermembrane receptor protein
LFAARRRVAAACAQACSLLALAALSAPALACDECAEAATGSSGAPTAAAPTATTATTPTGTLASAAAAAAAAAPQGDAAPLRTLGIVRVMGSAVSSLPSQIPTTLESLDAATLARTVNATDAGDALKYFPSLLVRKRYIGDYNHAVLSTRASGTGNSARSLVFADGILLSNLLGNGAAFTPRWGMVTPEEIARVDVMYGPFSAAYSGNGVGAIVDYQTRMPTRFEAHASLGYSHQPNELYGQSRSFDAKQASASLGSAEGGFSWWLSLSRQDSQGQPQTFATKLVSSGTTASTGTPVTGATLAPNRANQDWWVLGSGTEYETQQNQAKLKLAYELQPGLRANYVLGLWDNGSDGQSRSFLQDASGNTVTHLSGGALTQTINLDGKRYTLSASDFPQTRDDLLHVMHGFSLKQRGQEHFNWELAASLYDYQKDSSRAYAPTSTAAPNAGRITDQAGTGWDTLSAKASWHPAGREGAHRLDVGLAQEHYQLRNRVDNTSDWRWGSAQSLASRFEGETRIRAAYAQDAWQFAPDWMLVLGLRGEHWQASQGLTVSGSNTLAHPERSRSDWSPKAALSWGLAESWVLKASTGRAVRYPTVSELYQGGFNSAGQAINNNPDLRPERSWTSELSAEWTPAQGRSVRATFFHEDSRDALYSQLNVATNANTVQNIDHIRTRGLELAASRGLGHGLDLTGSLTYTDSIILANSGYATVAGDTVGKQQPRVPRWRATLLGSWQAREDLSLSLGLRYSGKQYSTLDNSDPNGFAYQGASKYFTADVRAQWRINRQWSLAGGIDNLNNYQYWNFHPYPQRTFHVALKFDL